MRHAAPIVALIVASGCGWVIGPGILTITSHEDGQLVHQRTLTIEGSSPPNARIVQDIALGPNQDTMADENGRWAFPVELIEGRNVFTFRIGDHMDTEQAIALVFEPVNR